MWWQWIVVIVLVAILALILWINWMWGLVVIYVTGFVLVLWFNFALGMITPGLAFLRAAVWPIYVMTGWPQGEQLPMD